MNLSENQINILLTPYSDDTFFNTYNGTTVLRRVFQLKLKVTDIQVWKTQRLLIPERIKENMNRTVSLLAFANRLLSVFSPRQRHELCASVEQCQFLLRFAT
uniref:Uncharacterized protein n=1 Tax=Pararge aegeria TaxID=116150 RepID=S4PRN5_9NEOP